MAFGLRIVIGLATLVSLCLANSGGILISQPIDIDPREVTVQSETFQSQADKINKPKWSPVQNNGGGKIDHIQSTFSASNSRQLPIGLSQSINGVRDPRIYANTISSVNSPYISRSDIYIQGRIENERQEETRREVQKAYHKKEELLRDMKLRRHNSDLGMSRDYHNSDIPNSRGYHNSDLAMSRGYYNEDTFDRIRRLREEQFGKADIDRERMRYRKAASSVLSKRILGDENVEIDLQRDRDRAEGRNNNQERDYMARNRDQAIRDSFADSKLEEIRERELRKFENAQNADRERERDRAMSSRIPRTEDNEQMFHQRDGIVSSPIEIGEREMINRQSNKDFDRDYAAEHRAYSDDSYYTPDRSKPPILILEKVPVPVSATDVVISPPCIQCSNDHHHHHIDEMYPQDRDEILILDRRPGRPVGPAVLEHQEVIFAAPAINPNLAAAAKIGQLTKLQQAAEIGRIQRTKIALAAQAEAAIHHQVVAQQLGKQAILAQGLKQQAAIAHAHRQQIALAHHAAAARHQHAKLAHVAATKNAILTRAATKDAALKNAASQQQQQAILAEASRQQAAIAISDSKKRLIDTVSIHDQLTKNKEMDFLQLAIKNGLQNALKTQLTHQIMGEKIKGGNFLLQLQTTKKDLIHRLSLLRPYFTANHGGLIIPEYLPQIPVAGHITSSMLPSLPQVHLGPIKLIESGFHIPPEMKNMLDVKLDIKFIEFILRLPEIVFQQVLLMPKRELIIVLFPRLYRETVKQLSHDPILHYHPNIPHSGEKINYHEHDHHHISHLPNDQSTYISYNQHHPFEFHKDHNYGAEDIAFAGTTPVPIIITPGPSTHNIFGISVRPKGEAHVSTLAPNLFGSSYKPSIFFNTEGRIHESIPLHKETLRKTITHELTKGHVGVSTSRPIKLFQDNLGGHFSTIRPIVNTGVINPSTLNPVPVSPIITPRPVVFTTSFRPPTSTLHLSNIPINFPTPTPKPVIATSIRGILGNNFVDSIDDLNSIAISSTPRPIISSTYPSTFDIISTIASYDGTVSPNFISPFRGFTGNVRQKTALEKLLEHGERYNDLSREPGTDVNDDNHVISAFSKKKGNITEEQELKDQIKSSDVDRADIPLTSAEMAVDNSHGVGSLNYHKSNQPSSSAEQVVNRIKEISRIFGKNVTPQEHPTIVEYENKISQNSLGTNRFFPPHSNFNYGSSGGFNNLQAETMPQSTVSERQGEPLNQSQTNKKAPQPQKIRPFQTSVNPLASSGFPIPGLFPGGGRRVQGHAQQMPNQDLPHTGLDKIPEFLKEEPQCATTEEGKKSFCLMPSGYPSDEAESMVTKHKSHIEELQQVIQMLPQPKLDLQMAFQQIPNLQLNIPCQSVEKTIELSWSRDILGSWLAILQTEPYKQIVSVTTCSPMARLQGCRPLLQPRPLIAFHPKDEEMKPLLLEFPLPVACVNVNTK